MTHERKFVWRVLTAMLLVGLGVAVFQLSSRSGSQPALSPAAAQGSPEEVESSQAVDDHLPEGAIEGLRGPALEAAVEQGVSVVAPDREAREQTTSQIAAIEAALTEVVDDHAFVVGSASVEPVAVVGVESDGTMVTNIEFIAPSKELLRVWIQDMSAENWKLWLDGREVIDRGAGLQLAVKTHDFFVQVIGFSEADGISVNMVFEKPYDQADSSPSVDSVVASRVVEAMFARLE